jgi:CBS domain-containing protein
VSNGSDYLKAIKKNLEQGQRQWKRGDKVLEAFGYVRRRQEFVDQVNSELERLGLVAQPPVSTALNLHGYTWFYLKAIPTAEVDGGSLSAAPPPDVIADEEKAEIEKADLAEAPKVDLVNPADLGVTVRNLECATNPPLTVKPETSIESALTMMQLNDYSQLVVATGERSIKGVVSYRSIAREQLHGSPKIVDDCMEVVPQLTLNDPLLDAVARFQQCDCVLVLGDDKKLCGIITPADIAREFHAMTAPFLIIGEIETHLRWFIDRSALNLADVTISAAPQPAAGNVASSAADLSIGELERILENPEYWGKVGIAYDRAEFCKALDDMRRFRNQTMHFGDPLSAQEVNRLRNLANALRVSSAAMAKAKG